MPIKVDELKEIPEELLFRGRGADIKDKIITFLQNHNDTAYSANEISVEINKDVDKYITENISTKFKRISPTVISATLMKLSKIKGTNINRKGIYYWFEKQNAKK